MEADDALRALSELAAHDAKSLWVADLERLREKLALLLEDGREALASGDGKKAMAKKKGAVR